MAELFTTRAREEGTETLDSQAQGQELQLVNSPISFKKDTTMAPGQSAATIQNCPGSHMDMHVGGSVEQLGRWLLR